VKKRVFVSVISVVSAVLLFCSLNVYATPYSNYTFDHKGDFYYEPQAMIPDAYYDWTKMIEGNPDEAELRKTPFKQPEDLLIDSNGYVFISDTGNNRVIMLDNKFKLLSIITNYETDKGTRDFKQPTGLALDNDGYLYVCDLGNESIVKFEYNFSGEYKTVRIFDDPELPDVINTGVSAIPGYQTTAPAEGEATEEPELNEEEKSKETEQSEESKISEEEEEKKDTKKSGYVYQPMRVVIDKTNRLYVLSKGLNQGILELDRNGKFAQFIAPARVTLTPTERLRRLFMSEEQLRRSRAPVPPAYNSVAIDNEGFLYVTTASITSAQISVHIRSGKNATEQGAIVRRVNASGVDVLKRNGNWPPAGDIILDRGFEENTEVFSYLVDVAVYQSGIYSVLDYRRSKVFTYDQEGNLLFVYGCKGTVFGAFDSAAALAVMPDNKSMAVLDGKVGQINVYRPTEYAEIILEANRLHGEFEFEASNEMWDRLLRISSNSEIGYIGKGKYEYQQGNYKSAMKYFRLGNDRENYSKALELYRKEILEVIMPYILWIVLIGVLFLVGFSINRRIQRIRRGEKVI